MREGWRGVAVVTGSRPSLAQQVLIGITISVKGEGAGKGEGHRPLSLPASFALVLAVCFRALFSTTVLPIRCHAPHPPPPQYLVEHFHFKHLLPFQLHSYQQLSAPSSPCLFSPSPNFHFYFPIHFCLPLNALSSYFTPSSCLSIFTLLGDRKQSPQAALQMKKIKSVERQGNKM